VGQVMIIEDDEALAELSKVRWRANGHARATVLDRTGRTRRRDWTRLEPSNPSISCARHGTVISVLERHRPPTEASTRAFRRFPPECTRVGCAGGR